MLRACEALRSGKTAAFALPTLERLLFRPKRMRAARVQEVDSSSMPDIVVATPGCMIDHLRNARADYVVFSDNDWEGKEYAGLKSLIWISSVNAWNQLRSVWEMLRRTRGLAMMLYSLVVPQEFPRFNNFCRISIMGRSSARVSTLTRLWHIVLLFKLLSWVVRIRRRSKIFSCSMLPHSLLGWKLLVGLWQSWSPETLQSKHPNSTPVPCVKTPCEPSNFPLPSTKAPPPSFYSPKLLMALHHEGNLMQANASPIPTRPTTCSNLGHRQFQSPCAPSCVSNACKVTMCPKTA